MGLPSASQCVVCKRGGALMLVHKTARSQDDPLRYLYESDLERVHAAAPRPKAMSMQSTPVGTLGILEGPQSHASESVRRQRARFPPIS